MVVLSVKVIINSPSKLITALAILAPAGPRGPSGPSTCKRSATPSSPIRGISVMSVASLPTAISIQSGTPSVSVSCAKSKAGPMGPGGPAGPSGPRSPTVSPTQAPFSSMTGVVPMLTDRGWMCSSRTSVAWSAVAAHRARRALPTCMRGKSSSPPSTRTLKNKSPPPNATASMGVMEPSCTVN